MLLGPDGLAELSTCYILNAFSILDTMSPVIIRSKIESVTL